jgi:hypothetical protein
MKITRVESLLVRTPLKLDDAQPIGFTADGSRVLAALIPPMEKRVIFREHLWRTADVIENMCARLPPEQRSLTAAERALYDRAGSSPSPCENPRASAPTLPLRAIRLFLQNRGR